MPNLVTGAVFVSNPSATVPVVVAIWKNGAPVRGSLRRGTSSSSDQGIETTKVVLLAPGDFVEIAALQLSGGAIATYQDVNYGSSMSIAYQRA